MVLRVSNERFAEEVKARLGTADVYVMPSGRHAVATAGSVEKGFVLHSEFNRGYEQTCDILRDAGLNPTRGKWSDTMEDCGIDEQPIFIVAIAYRSEEPTPGLWIDSDVNEISSGEALKRMYEEFRDNGEIKEVSFDEFVRVIHPNVMVLAPHQIQGWAEDNRPDL